MYCQNCIQNQNIGNKEDLLQPDTIYDLCQHYICQQ